MALHATFNRADAGSSPVWRSGHGKEGIMPVIDMVATGNNIKGLMADRGLAARDVMAGLGFNNPMAVYKWIRGLSLPTLDNLVILADLLGVRMDDIIVVRQNTDIAV